MASSSTSSIEQELLQLIRAKLQGGTQQQQEYPYPCNVNPRGMISIVLYGKNTYNRWQEQMACLIESHDMQGFIDGRFKNPKETEINGDNTKYEEWKRSDSIVKGWIFGSLSKNVMSSVVSLPTAIDVWMKLKITYGPLKGSQQYPYPCDVQPNKFVSVKLSGEKNYRRWQEKIARFIERHGMQGFIDGRYKSPKESGDSENTEGDTAKYEEWKRSDLLVKGWIFGSLSEDVMGTVVGLPTAMDVWNKLNISYGANNKGTQQYPYPCHVQPNDFVSIVLSSHINYNRWQEQMVCLIESHGMDGFMNGRFKNPKDSGDSQNTEDDITKYEEWKRSDSLVKGWIFGSLSKNVMGTVVGLPTTMDVWKKLTITYGALTTTDNKETQQYPYPSHDVKPINFVSIKLCGEKNYSDWREQMTCLIESHDMKGFIDGRFKAPEKICDNKHIEGKTTKYEEWKRSDSLVKRWIVGSLKESIKATCACLPTALDVWNKLNTTCSTPPMPTLTIIDNKELTQQYSSCLTIPHFYNSIKLLGQKNYSIWQAGMVRYIESNGWRGFIDGSLKNPKENGEITKYDEWKRSDSYVKGLIFGSLTEHIMDIVIGLPTAMDVWKKLYTTYGTDNKGKLQYPYPSQAQPSYFVSLVLFGQSNYHRWREQMWCMIESHDMQGFIDGRFKNPKENSVSHYNMEGDNIQYEEWKRSDSLVKQWIFNSLCKRIQDEVVQLPTAFDVWRHLNTRYRVLTTKEDKALGEKIALQRAIVQGQWETARLHFNKDNDVSTVGLNPMGRKALHFAIETNADIAFLKNLLKEIDPESLPVTELDNCRSTPLHTAALVGNHEAAKMLVEMNPSLLFISSNAKRLPIHEAASCSQKKTFLYLLEASKQHIMLCEQERYQSPFQGRNGAMLLDAVIHQGMLDVAYELIKEEPEMARTKWNDFDNALSCIAGKLELYYSGKQYNFYQRFVYSYVPIPIDNIVNVDSDNHQDIGNQEMLVSRCFRSVTQKIYAKFWELTLLYVSHVKHLKEDKVKHNKALTLLKCICEEVGKMNSHNGIWNHVIKASNLAAINDTSEAIKEIIMHFPEAVIYLHINGYCMLQSAIKNRSEKVYNLLVHDLSTNMFIYKCWVDQDGYNMLHLAGELAPIHKLNMISGAALQMQRELQWFKEVEKYVERKQMEAKNKNGETPIMLFRKEHLELRIEGEQWMKKTADAYTITAALIITIVFAAAVTVHGGNNDQTGKAVYTTKTSFTIFAISDAISLFTSTTSLLLFLSILTARYRDEDFLYRLPKRLIFGLVMLFLSVTSMMVAFSATLYLTFGQEKAWILIPIAALTCLPITSFVTLQLPLLVELISSTYGSGIFGKNN